MNQIAIAKGKFVTTMVIFGTIGIFVRYIPLPSGAIAFVRGIVGALFMLLVSLVKREKTDKTAVKKNLFWLCLSGAAIGVNWILLFESYRYTTVAISTLCYYLAPIFVVIASPVILREKLTLRKILCVAAALFGMVGVSGVTDGALPTAAEITGILLGIGAAILYASVTLMNKQIRGVPPRDKTVIQLASAGLVILPYSLLAEDLSSVSLTFPIILLLITVGILHTGVAYLFYFSSLEHIRAQSAAIMSYIDPIVAILLSAVLLKEPLSLTGGIGAIMILGAAIVSELPERKRSSSAP